MKDKNFEIVAAAQDTGGTKVADRWYEKAKVTYTALVDTKHTVSSLYQMVNVPTGVWIDETGKIVRPAEVAYSKQEHVLGQDIGDDRYAIGLGDWVENGSKSSFAMPAEALQARLAVRDARQRMADAQFKLGAYFSEQGKRRPGDQALARSSAAQSRQLELSPPGLVVRQGQGIKQLHDQGPQAGQPALLRPGRISANCQERRVGDAVSRKIACTAQRIVKAKGHKTRTRRASAANRFAY